MAEEGLNYVCAECGAPRIADDALRSACPQCGCTRRLVKKPINIEPRGHVSMSAKAKTPGGRKPFLEHLSGAFLRRKTREWVQKVRRIDRGEDRYFEEVTDPETGEVIHHCDEPLSEHRGHGSAKRKDDA